MGSCSSTLQREQIKCNLIKKYRSLEFENNLIVSGHFRKFEKSNNLFMSIPTEISKCIALYCNDEKLMISTPTVAIKSISTSSIILYIENNDNDNNNNNIIGHKIKYESIDSPKIHPSLQSVTNSHHSEHEILIKHRDDNSYKIDKLNPNTSYIISIKSINHYNIHSISSNILQFKTNKLMFNFDLITQGFDNMIENNGKLLNTKLDLYDPLGANYIVAGCSNACNSGKHKYKLKVIGNNVYTHCDDDIFGIVSDHFGRIRKLFESSDEYLSNTHCYYYFSSNGNIYTRYFDYNASIVYRCCAQKLKKTGKRWKNNNVISMTLDCDQWTLSYKIGYKSFKINIEKNQTYYVFMRIRNDWHRNIKYKIVS